MKIKFINNKFNYNKKLKIITGALFLSITLTGCQNNKVNEFGDLLINNPIGECTPDEIVEPIYEETEKEDKYLVIDKIDYNMFFEILKILDDTNSTATLILDDNANEYIINSILDNGHNISSSFIESKDIINPKSYNTEELRDEIVEYSRIYNMHSLENKVLKKSLN